MTNNRVFYAIQAVGIAPHGSGLGADPSGFIAAHGVQSVGIDTNFKLDPVSELGQLELYENVEGIPDIQVTAQKVLDGYPLLYHLATPDATTSSLVGRSAGRCFVGLNVYSDLNDNASGVPLTAVGMSGMYISSLKYGFPVDGNATEDVTLVCNDKLWRVSGWLSFRPAFDGTDAPLSLASSGGVQRREDILMGESPTSSRWPTLIPGITVSGTNPVQGDGFAAHIQNVTISCDLGRTDLNELGHRKPYHKYANLPISVTCAIEITASEGDNVDAESDPSSGSNLSDETIVVQTREGTRIDLLGKNKLTSINYTGGGVDGGPRTITYNFETKNIMIISHPQDPAGL